MAWRGVSPQKGCRAYHKSKDLSPVGHEEITGVLLQHRGIGLYEAHTLIRIGADAGDNPARETGIANQLLRVANDRHILADSRHALETCIRNRKAISLQPNNTMYLNNFAWMLATNPKSTPQDRQEAVKLTLRAVKLTGGKIARIVDTLAVAYAANGNFTKAIDIAEKALQLAAGNEELRKEINGRVERYKAKLPYTE